MAALHRLLLQKSAVETLKVMFDREMEHFPRMAPLKCASEVICTLRSVFESFATMLVDGCDVADYDSSAMRALSDGWPTFLSLFETTFTAEFMRVPGKTALETAKGLISAYRIDFDLATRDFYNEFAAAKCRDPVACLPTEIAFMCFQWLSLRSRITVSHVCRAWRAAALSDRRLWNSYDTPWNLPSKAFLIPLTVLLSRSDPLPFYVKLHLKDDPRSLGEDGDIVDILSCNMSRIAALTLNFGVSQLLALDAPALRMLDARQGSDGRQVEFLIPSQWEQRNVARLEFLALDFFLLTSDCPPFTSLHTLHAIPPICGARGISFIRIFPNLTKLELQQVTQDSLSMLSPLPSSIKVVRLMSSAPFAGIIDYSHFLSQSCIQCSITELYICYSTTISYALELFVHAVQGLWTMEISMEKYLLLKAPASDSSWTIHCREDILLTRDWPCAAVLRQLSDLKVPLRTFVDLCHVENWDRRLPSLQFLTLVVDPEEGIRDVACRSPIQMQALSSLTLLGRYCIEAADFLLADAPDLLVQLLCATEVPLAVICIKLTIVYCASVENLSRLLQLAKRVRWKCPGRPDLSEIRSSIHD